MLDLLIDASIYETLAAIKMDVTKECDGTIIFNSERQYCLCLSALLPAHVAWNDEKLGETISTS